VPIPPELLIFARQLRKGQTDAEKLLWYLLRGRRFCGFKFRDRILFVDISLIFTVMMPDLLLSLMAVDTTWKINVSTTKNEQKFLRQRAYV